jgi:hypothetical protein
MILDAKLVTLGPHASSVPSGGRLEACDPRVERLCGFAVFGVLPA